MGQAWGGGGLIQPGQLDSMLEMLDIVSVQEVTEWGGVAPCQTDTISGRDRGSWPDE